MSTPEKPVAKETTPKNAASKKTSPSPATEPLDSAPLGSEEHFVRFGAAAKKLAASDVRPFRVDMSLALANAQTGAAAVLAHEATLTRTTKGKKPVVIVGDG